jgi:hypothetical protein
MTKLPVDGSDVDLRGRVRRHPQKEQDTRVVAARFLDGPLAGTMREVMKGVDYVRVGPWMYTFAGKDGRTPLYCKRLKSRRDRKLLHFVIAKRGADPRVQMAAMKAPPTKRTAPPAKGRGARRRAEKRANAAT